MSISISRTRIPSSTGKPTLGRAMRMRGIAKARSLATRSRATRTESSMVVKATRATMHATSRERMRKSIRCRSSRNARSSPWLRKLQGDQATPTTAVRSRKPREWLGRQNLRAKARIVVSTQARKASRKLQVDPRRVQRLRETPDWTTARLATGGQRSKTSTRRRNGLTRHCTKWSTGSATTLAKQAHLRQTSQIRPAGCGDSARCCWPGTRVRVERRGTCCQIQLARA
mmetsp:Transcript_13557/g.43278  ORF Transcript_13557/g.43278 Transcript_13557/m.43278 type:complete len:229 (+) Transcript_13557:398-1084(+)